MGYDNIKLKLKIELPGQVDVTPSTFVAAEKNKSRDGGLARTMAERFPFGLVSTRPSKKFEFNWGEENFKFIEDMHLTNERLNKYYKEKAAFQWLQKHLYHQFLLELEANNRHEVHLDALGAWQQQKIKDHVNQTLDTAALLFERVHKNYDERLSLFIKSHIDKRFEEQDSWKAVVVTIKNNPNDTRMKWPSDPSDLSLIRNKSEDARTKRDEQRAEACDRQEFTIDAKVNKLEQIYHQHKISFATGIMSSQIALTDWTPNEPKWGRKNTFNLELAEITPGALTEYKKSG